MLQGRQDCHNNWFEREDKNDSKYAVMGKKGKIKKDFLPQEGKWQNFNFVRSFPCKSETQVKPVKLGYNQLQIWSNMNMR